MTDRSLGPPTAAAGPATAAAASSAPTRPVPTPGWAEELGRSYVSGAASVFLLHGNLHDVVLAPPAPGSTAPRFVGVEEYLACELFGRRDVVLQYDRGSGLQILAGDEGERRRAMREELQRTLQAIDTVTGSNFGNGLPRDPVKVLDLLDRYLLHCVHEAADPRTGRRTGVAVLLRYAEMLAPSVEVSWLSGEIGGNLVKLLNWANDPAIRRSDVTLVLLCEHLADLNRRLIEHPHIVKIEVPLPSAAERRLYIDSLLGEAAADGGSTQGMPSAETLAGEANGLTLVGVGQVIARARGAGAGGGFDTRHLKRAKKEMIEKECFGLVEFVEPKHDLSMLVAPAAVKRRLEDDARLIREGRYEALPMGYLLCGVLGTGKTFASKCFAGSVGIPALVFQNLREKWVGSSEGNLQKVLAVVRALGPVVVVIDEADAALGKRSAEGDSGTSSRMFGMIASQMADTAYRGRILWMLLTARPDLLTVDLKRQGRAEVHIPLFPPQTEDERRDMVTTLARKNGITVDREALPPIPVGLSGADLESVVVQAIRVAALAGQPAPTPEILADVLARFVSPSYSVEKELQELVAIRETTDIEFVPEAKRAYLTDPHASAALDRRVAELRALLRE